MCDDKDQVAVLCILAHGDQHGVVGSDAKRADVVAIEACFNNENCPQMSNKPKIIMYQACQGSKYAFLL